MLCSLVTWFGCGGHSYLDYRQQGGCPGAITTFHKVMVWCMELTVLRQVFEGTSGIDVKKVRCWLLTTGYWGYVC